MIHTELFRKAQPTVSAVHVDAVLTDVSVAYVQDDTKFVAGKVFPTVPVMHKSDIYRTYPREHWFRSQAVRRAPGTPSEGSGWALDQDTYTCQRWALHKDIDDETRMNADPDIDLDRDATTFLTQQLLLLREIEWISAFFATGVWTSETTPANVWSDYTNGTPIEDVRAVLDAREQATGFRPNTIVMGPEVWTQLADHPDVIARIANTTTGVATLDLLGQIWGVPRIFVARGVQNTSQEGQTASYSYLAGKHMLVCYAAPAPSPLWPSAGYTFAWKGFMGAGPTGGRTKTFRMEENESDRIEVELAFDMKQVADDLGHFFLSCVA